MLQLKYASVAVRPILAARTPHRGRKSYGDESPLSDQTGDGRQTGRSGPGTGKRDQYTINNYISIYLPAILRCFRIAGFLFSKEGCYITQNEVNAVFDEQVRLCADTLKRKTKEYTGDDPDRLGAFKAAAALQHTTPQRALAGMLAKHIVSLYDMCFAEEVVYPMDTWDEKITDSLNYLFLLKAIVKEGHTN